MNSQNLGDLASDQKIQNVFHAFGYSIPVGKDGRRLWPTKFKRAMGQRMRSGELSIGEVQKTCQVSNKTAYSWRKGGSRKSLHKPKKTQEPAPAFAEVKVQRDELVAPPVTPHIVFKRAGCEVLLPPNFPIDQLAQLISAFESAP
jgi:transposase-like protein